MAKGDKLTPKQAMFVEEYLVDLNATQAAIRAGYNPRTAKVIACQNLTKLNIQTAIQEGMREREKKVEVTQEMVIAELAKLAFSNINDITDWGETGAKLKSSSELSKDVTATVSEVSSTATKDGVNIKIKQYDKKGALELLGRHLGIFNDKLEVSGTVSVSSAIEEGRKRVQQGR